MSVGKRKMVLAYPPYCTPTAPPLGVCLLKAFVERSLPDWSVKVLDLNLSTHQDMVRRVQQQPGPVAGAFTGSVLSDIALLRAAETFRGEHGEEFFQRPDRYEVYADLWTRCAHPGTGGYQSLEQAYHDKGPLPEAITRHVEQVLQEQPEVVGISICCSQQAWFGICLAKLLKQRAGLPVVMGGTFFTNDADANWALHCQGVDCIIRGEGERPLVQFLAGTAKRQDIAGLTWLADGQVVKNPTCCEDDLDALGTPDFSDLDLRAYYCPRPVLPLLTSRGCYWRRCAFCVHYQSAGQTYRLRSVAQVVEELKRHVDRGIQHFSLVDEMISPARFSQLAAAIIAARLKVYYYAMAKPVKQFDRELLDKLHQSGCRYLMWGLESGSQRILDLMDKGTRVDEIGEVLQAAGQARIKNHVFVMVGFPTETRQEFQATLDLLDRHKAVIASVHRGIFYLEKGSRVFDCPEKYAIRRVWPAGQPPLQTWYEFDCSAGMSREEVIQAFTQALPLLRSFSFFATHLSSFRDHALVIYSQLDP